MAKLIKRYGMFTTNGNKMVGRIVEAAQKLIELDGDELNAWQFAYRELAKLGYSAEFGEATDTDVREQVYDAVVPRSAQDAGVPFYI